MQVDNTFATSVTGRKEFRLPRGRTAVLKAAYLPDLKNILSWDKF